MDKNANALTKFLEETEETVHSFAKRSGIAPSTLYQIYRGSKPIRSIALKICRHSRGKLSLLDFGHKVKKQAGEKSAGSAAISDQDTKSTTASTLNGLKETVS